MKKSTPYSILLIISITSFLLGCKKFKEKPAHQFNNTLNQQVVQLPLSGTSNQWKLNGYLRTAKTGSIYAVVVDSANYANNAVGTHIYFKPVLELTGEYKNEISAYFPELQENKNYQSFIMDVSGTFPASAKLLFASPKSNVLKFTIKAGQLYIKDNSTVMDTSIIKFQTNLPSSIQNTSANLQAEVIKIDATTPIIEYGFLWNKDRLNGNDISKKVISTARLTTGLFQVNLDSLESNTIYAYRAYVKTEKALFLSEIISFTTTSFVSVSSITSTSAILSGVMPTTATYTKIGFCWSSFNSNPYPNYSNTFSLEQNPSQRSFGIGSLTPSTTYYYRPYIVTSNGVVYGSVSTFKTLNENSTGGTNQGVPSLTTTYTKLSALSYNLTSTISSVGDSPITSAGFCYNTIKAVTPTISDNKTTVVYSSNVTNPFFNLTENNFLLANTTYYYRAFAINNSGVGYSSTQTFTTDAAGTVIPVLTINVATNITATTVTLRGSVTNSGTSTVLNRGFTYSDFTASPVKDLNTTVYSSSSSTSITMNITGLKPATTYYYRAFASNSSGTGYSTYTSFTTLASTPTLLTSGASLITANSATMNGAIENNGGEPVSESGFYYSTTFANQLNSSNANQIKLNNVSSGNLIYNLTSLTPNTTYYYNPYAKNSAGIAYGPVISFTTASDVVPNLSSTMSATFITSNSATLNGSILNGGGSAITQRGFCYSDLTTMPIVNTHSTIYSSSSSFSLSALASNLKPGTTYYYRAFATNSVGTGYSNVMSFTTK